LAILDLLENKKLDFKPLLTRTEPFENTPKLYDSLTEEIGVLGILLAYPENINLDLKSVKLNSPSRSENSVVIGMIGAGGFSSGVLIPAFKKTGVRLKTIASASGLSGHNSAKKFDIEENTTDYQKILSDMEINTVVISTPHNTHGKFVLESLVAGKNVFVEKPMALSVDELNEIEEFYNKSTNPPVLMVGFNRRFSPLSEKIKKYLEKSAGPKAIVYTVNSGDIPSDHWTQDPEVGGQRLIGEGCHFIDYIKFIVGKKITNSNIVFADVKNRDVFTISLGFEDGSIGTVHYFSNGNKAFSKERVEIFCDGSIYTLDNFRKLDVINASGNKKTHKLSSQDKGHKSEVKKFVDWIEGKESELISLEDLFEISRLSIELNE
jgi:predicted dehydrogenase